MASRQEGRYCEVAGEGVGGEGSNGKGGGDVGGGKTTILGDLHTR